MIDTLVTDCDGVLTDGKYYYSVDGRQLVSFHTYDSSAFGLAIKVGIKCMIITSSSHPQLYEVRAKEWGIPLVIAPNFGKLAVLSELVDLEHTAYIGDALDDIPVFKKVGMSFCPSTAFSLVQRYANVVLESGGGTGCILEMLLMVLEYNKINIKEVSDALRLEK